MPDYLALVRFLIEPLLDRPSALSLDCETNSAGDRLRVRIAFDALDKGRVLGRHGRTIQAIRTVVTTTAQSASQVVHLDIYDPNPTEKHVNRENSEEPRSRSRSAPLPKRKSIE